MNLGWTQAVVLVVIQGVILMILKGIGSAVWAMVENLKRIDEHLVKLNGRIGKTEQWQEMHEAYDAERFKSIHELLEAKTEK